MKITSVATTYYVEHDEHEYRTTNGKSWERAYGESWEQEYSPDAELLEGFNKAWPDSCTRWHRMMILLGRLYDRFNTEGVYWDEIQGIVTELLDAYNDWID